MIVFSTSQLAELRAHAAAAYPHEACGLLLGQHRVGAWRVSRLMPSDNLADDPAHHFEVDPRLRLELQRELRGDTQDGEDVIGHYHSHPDGAAAPSATDRAMAWEPELIWVIAAASATGTGEVRAYRVSAAKAPFSELPLAVDDQAHEMERPA